LNRDAFALTAHRFGDAMQRPIELRPMTSDVALRLACRLAAIPPWSTMNYPAEGIGAYLTREDLASRRFAILREGALAGVLAVRWPWLRGPYLELLGLAPEFQGQGLGAAALDWMEREGSLVEARWLWLLVSSFNARAIAFYQRRGFERVANLDDLVANGFTEILMRKRCPPRQG
jgi:ribosomal protein S18 acetylase RimI-like enzyme